MMAEVFFSLEELGYWRVMFICGYVVDFMSISLASSSAISSALFSPSMGIWGIWGLGLSR